MNIFKLLLPTCCSPEPNEGEVKFYEHVDGEGYAQGMPVLPPTKPALGSCGEKCCEQDHDANEVVVVPQAAAVGTPEYKDKKGTAAFPGYDINAERYQTGFVPIPSDGESRGTISTVREYPQVPQIVGLSDLAKSHTDLGAHPDGFEVDLVREGPEWSNLGMLVSPNAANQDNLNIDEIDANSLLGSWNAKRPRHEQVMEGDIIVAVNGRVGQELIREIQQTSDQGCRIKLLIVRAVPR
jgi:hypothetical protein